MFLHKEDANTPSRSLFRLIPRTFCSFWAARSTGFSEMTDHRFLTKDRLVQETEFADGTVVTVNFALGLRTFVSPINILPIAASACATVALWLERPRLTKIVLAFVSASFLVYDIFVGSYIGILNEVFGISSIIIYFIREAIQKRREKNEKGVQ